MMSQNRTTSNKQRTICTPDDSTTEISALTSTDPAATTADTTIVTEAGASTPNPASTTADFTTTKDVITTTTRSTQSTTKTTTAKPIECENGGTPYPNNQACFCPKGFTGRLCSTVVTEIVPDNIERTVNVTMEINESFTDDFKNSSSDAYKNFEEKFNRTVVKSYEKISTFLHVANIILSAGGPLQNSQRRKRSLSLKETNRETASLKVEHDVLLDIENSKENQNTYENSVNKVRDALVDIKNNPDSGLVVNNAIASETGLGGVCAKATDGFLEGYEKYFEAVVIDDIVKCLTQCSPEHNNMKICKNRGTCEVSDQGPSC
ncbi:hypothetical protein cypCar_00029889 [Cyprinus carpio]|nr:hypothetical protein cypCar_00029889 [Cyprinus carpio]